MPPSTAAATPRDPAKIAAAATAQKTCPEGAKWNVIPDNRPLKECGDLPLEQGCMLSDGRKHGTWVVYEKRTLCKQPASIRAHVQGRQDGNEQLFVLVCAGKGKQEKCRSILSESGPNKDDKRHGLWRKFADSGAKLEEGRFFEGTRQGPWTAFSPAGKPTTVTCFHDGKQKWQATPEQTATKAMPCAVTRQKKAETGIATVSEDEAKASKLVRLAQSTPKVALRVRYLQKAVQLAPNNARYKKLLEAAQAEAKSAAASGEGKGEGQR